MTKHEYLLLPASTDTRILELARDLGRGTTDVDRAHAIELWLQTRLSYTTDLPAERSADPLAQFLFERRKGHCEYFASAMAVMLRAIHIPARVVTGFQSGTYNPMTGWQVIRASDAHSWVEAWIPDTGWTTFDPTPPDMRGSQGASAVWSKLMLYVDALDTMWRDWVVNYNLESQVDLVSRIERRSRLMGTGSRFAEAIQWAVRDGASWARNFIVAGGGLLILGAFGWIFGPPLMEWLRSRQQTARLSRGQVVASDAALLYLRMLKVLRRRGLEKPGWLTPAEFARIVPPTSSDARLVEQITEAYHDLRYAGRAEAGPRMIQLLQELEARR
jgi:hypothetical protein